LRVWRLEGSYELARGGWRAEGDWKRLQTPGRLEPVYGVAPRFIRIDTLKCGEVTGRLVFGHVETGLSKHMRGGREPRRMDW
jgi:hypothetical protein